MVIINMAMMIVMIKMGIMMMVMIMMMIKCLQTQAQRSKITWPECLAHWQSAQSLSKAASRLRPFLLSLMLLVVSFLLHLAISNMGHEKQLYKRRVVHLGRARLGERGGLKTPTLG